MMGRGDRPMTLDLSPDLTILAFTATAGALTTLVFGLAPALRATAIEPFTTLRESSAGAGGGKTIGLARALVVGQVALSLVLLAGAGLFVRTLHNLRSVDLGFEESGLLRVNGLQGGFKDAALADLYERIQTYLETVPGVQSATMTPFALLASSASNYSLTIPGYVPKADERVGARVLHVGSRFFETMGLRLALGRPLEARDREDAPLVAVATRLS